MVEYWPSYDVWSCSSVDEDEAWHTHGNFGWITWNILGNYELWKKKSYLSKMWMLKAFTPIKAASSILRVPSLKPTKKTLSDHVRPLRPFQTIKTLKQTMKTLTQDCDADHKDPVADYHNLFYLHMLENAGIASAWIWWVASKLSWPYVKRLRSYESLKF